MYSFCYILIIIALKELFFRSSQQHQTEGTKYSPGTEYCPSVLSTTQVHSTVWGTVYSPGTEYCPGY